MKPAITNAVCRLRCAGHCGQCREDAGWRRGVGTPEVCGDARGPWTGLGDKVSSVLTPIGHAIGHPCVDRASGNLKPRSRCDKMKRWLNRLG